MLTSLTIQNYALISELEIDFSAGFSVLTGETGAGKSIILGALALILGQRADSKYIKQGENKCVIEGIFDISSYHLKSFFEEKELEYDESQCILRRELYASGKSRAFINDTPAGLNDLKELGMKLIDIHSQHENLDLADGQFQLEVLDALAGNQEIKNNYDSNYQTYRSTVRKWEELKAEAARNLEEKDYLLFQCLQLEEAKLDADEQEELESESKELLHAEEIKTALFQIEIKLSEEETGVVTSLKSALNATRSLTSVFAKGKEISERLETAYLDLKDLALEVANYKEKTEYDPERLRFVNERLDTIYALQQKHKVESVRELITLRNDLQARLQSIENLDETLKELQQEVTRTREILLKSAQRLSQSRKKAASVLEKMLVQKVSVLGMPHMQFICELTQKEKPDVAGIDKIRFLFSANKNVPLKPVSEIASGGEIARLMLGIKALIAGAIALPTIIFDEIDTGVSGEIADKMAKIMQELGEVMQVIVITHLPQIAAKGKTHYFVYKKENEVGTETNIRKLSDTERVREIAQMLSGEKLTEAALENAKILLNL